MRNFAQVLEKDTAFQQILGGLQKKKTPILASGLPDVHKGQVAYSLAALLNQSAHIVVPTEAIGNRIRQDINTMLGHEGAVLYPARELVFHEIEGISLEYEHIRLGVLGKIINKEVTFVISTVESASQYTLPPADYAKHTLTLQTGASYDLNALMMSLLEAGYQRSEQVEGVSQFALRGGILDIMPTASNEPYRIEFWGNDIDTISTFDLLTQRRGDSLESLHITPAREILISNRNAFVKTLEQTQKKLRGSVGVKAKELIAADIEKLQNDLSLPSADKYLSLLYPEPATLFDYCRESLLFLCEPVTLKENHKNFLWQQQEDIKVLLEGGVLFAGSDTFTMPEYQLATEAEKNTTVIMDTFNRSLPEVKLASMAQINAIQLAVWSGDYQLLLEDIQEYYHRNYAIVVLAGTPKAAKALGADLMRDGLEATVLDHMPELRPKTVTVLEGSFSAGLEYSDMRVAILTHSRTGAEQRKKRRRHKEGKKLRSISDLSVGDYVVHVSHGIGVFRGINQRNIHGVIKDFIKIQYSGTDALFVPVTQLDLVSKYIGAAEGAKVKLNRLNSVEWTNTRNKVKSAVKEMAKELTILYAKRQNAKGFAFSEDNNWQQEFEERFAYEETEDQLQSINEIKADMEKPMPMDRLLCGDVGFGKTEVALRAIFKAVMDSKQVAVLVPTTILAWQHYQTFLQRLEGYPVKVELLSRFRKPKEQKEILKELKRGNIDVVVGTHRVVQKDVEFKDLGLCVIDEEQRFGVAHKERFKELRADIDILTLSATPIPRTLNMAMSGIRDMSLIEEAPQDRHPVQTYVLEYEQGILTSAIEKELRRGGQVFYIHNRIDTIESCAARLQEELPEARIVTAHGKMAEEAMSEVWRQLVEQEADILVCTTIIETGVDVPNCNTLIIEDADNYGLSQLYQLRGRVGRSTRRAYAYFTFRRGKALTEVATKRLSAIREFTTFGSGFRIAMRDLEIRGAGNILGAQQHGHMAAVGYDMYLRLLAEAVQEETGEVVQQPTDCIIDIQVDAYIPDEYIKNLSQRIDMYKKIAAIASEEEALDVMDELIDRFGDPPKAVKGLVDVAVIRGTASRLGMMEVKQTEQHVILYPKQFDLAVAGMVAGKMKGRMLVNAGSKPYYSVKLQKGENLVILLRETLHIMASDEDNAKN